MEDRHELQIRLRKNRDTLVAVGYGVIAFGVWSVVKSVLYSAFNTEELLNGSGGEVPVWAFWIFMGVVLAVDLGIRLRVGLSAIAEGKGKKKRVGYIVVALLMALIGFALVVVTVIALGTGQALGRSLVSVVVEATSSVLLVEMAVSAMRVKRLGKKLADGES